MGQPIYIIDDKKFTFDCGEFNSLFCAYYEREKGKNEICNKTALRRELEEVIGAGEGTVKDWILGRHLPRKKEDVLKVADYLGIDPKKILIEEGEPIMSNDVHESKPILNLDSIDSIDELQKETDKIINLVEVDNAYEKTIRRFLKLQLFELLGYEIYYFGADHKRDEDWPLDWSLIASDVEMVLDICDTIPISSQAKDFPFLFKNNLYACKVEFIAYLIGGELFEDQEIETYKKSVAKKAYDCGYELLNMLPEKDNTVITSYKASLLSLRDVLDNIVS